MKPELKMCSYSCEDYILYYDCNNDNVAYEVQFDNHEFNGTISICTNLGKEDEEYKLLEDKDIYSFIKEKAIIDFNNMKKC